MPRRTVRAREYVRDGLRGMRGVLSIIANLEGLVALSYYYSLWEPISGDQIFSGVLEPLPKFWTRRA
eukprot:jgi/Botrbrau1/7333/Bobra.247_3s0028.1